MADDHGWTLSDEMSPSQSVRQIRLRSRTPQRANAASSVQRMSLSTTAHTAGTFRSRTFTTGPTVERADAIACRRDTISRTPSLSEIVISTDVTVPRFISSQPIGAANNGKESPGGTSRSANHVRLCDARTILPPVICLDNDDKSRRSGAQSKRTFAKMVAEVTGPEMGPSKGAVSTNRVTQLMSKEARLLQRDDGLTQREAEVMRKKAELTDREAKLVRDQAELMRRSEVIGAGLLLSAEVIQPLRSTQQEIRDLDAGHEEALLAHGAEIAVLQRRVQVARARCEATVRRYEGAKMVLLTEEKRQLQLVTDVIGRST